MASTLRRLAISAFLIAHLAAVAIWNMPDCAIRSRCLYVCGYYLLPLGLWQSWGMFAPEPARDTAALEAVVVDARGLMHSYAFPTTADLSPWRAALKYRDAKFAANMAPEELRANREMAARHVVRSLGLGAPVFPVVLQLQYQVRAAPAPGGRADEPPAPPTPSIIETYRFATFADAQP